MAKRTARTATRSRRPKGFDVAKLDRAIKTSPVKLKAWLDHHIPWLIGPRIDSVEPAGAQRGTIVTIHGGQFAAARGDNHVTIGGTAVPVVAASATELRVLATVDVDSGPVKVAVGAHTATAAQDFTVQGYPGDGDDGPPVFATGA